MIRLALLALVAISSGCATATYRPALQSEGPFHETRKWSQPLVSAEAFYEDHELDEIEFDEDLEDIFGDGINAVERQRAGVRLSVGVNSVSGYVQVFTEDIDDFDADDLNTGTALDFDDAIGVGIGARGEVVLSGHDTGARVLFVYRVGGNLVFGEGDFMDTNGGTPLKSADENGDYVYFENEFQGGVGVEIHGFRTTVGAYTSLLYGVVEDDIIAGSDDDLTFSGANTGLFIDLRYKHPDFPMRCGVRGTAGDVKGVEVFLGFAL